MRAQKNKPLAIRAEDYTYEYFMHSGGAKEFLNNGLGEVYDKVIKLADRSINNVKKITVLDLGCGRGELLKEYAKRGDICYGVDYAQAAVDIAKESIKVLPKEQKENIYIIQKDLKELDFRENMFDLVFMLDVIEHLYPWEIEIILSKIHKILKPNGALVIHTYPTKCLIGFMHLVMGLFGLRSMCKHLHPNVQSFFSMRKILKPCFGDRAKIWLEKRPKFLSQNLSNDYNIFLKKTGNLLDGISDNHFFSQLLMMPLFRHFFSTDIWVVAFKSLDNT